MPIKKALRPLYRDPAYIEARAAAKERSGDRCERCGRANKSLYDVITHKGADTVWREVVVQCGGAHLDQDPRNNAPENVLWLCRGCHLRHDAGPHARKARVTRATRKDAGRPLLAVPAIRVGRRKGGFA